MTKNKRPKRDMAKKMMSNEEKDDNISPFNARAWVDRAEFIKKRELKKIKKYEKS